jgi:hypothetical protein
VLIPGTGGYADEKCNAANALGTLQNTSAKHKRK